ncbi:DUF1206 domain-containing protein [Croceibacterium aestuarii]|uniref:DUF1206 domain-containing protein n=1 Tax=Croceibacterium aestuarii TaxID=3064139 RepID=UPI00272DDD49|nr:DUF1206 domain-containing protein [Croceibacterium sp. D39]
MRLGYASRGLTYFLLGYMALGTRARPDEGNQAVFDMLQDVPLGTPLLYLIALGLVAYVVFKLASAVGDVQHRGTDTTGVAKRIGDAASAVAYSILALAAFQFAQGTKQAADSGQSEQAAATVLDWTLGSVVVGAVGLGFLAAAFMQAKGAITASFMHRVSSRAPGAIEPVGRAGYGARAVVFALVGWSIVKAAWFDSGTQVSGLGEALMSLRGSGIAYTAVCIGLMLFGAFSMAVSRYRIIPDFGSEGLKPSFR